MGQINRRVGHPAWISLSQLAERTLRQAEEALDPSIPPEDALAVYANRAGILMNLGADAEAEQPLRQALQLVDIPSARVQDIARVGHLLRAKKKPDQAEEILKSALEKASDPADQARIRMVLGWCAFEQGRTDEALSIADALLSERDRRSANSDWEVYAGAGDLRIHALLARNEPTMALALADAELDRAAGPWSTINVRVFYWIRLLARALGRTGRARDAEVILRKILDLPVEVDTTSVALGLSSREVVLSFLSSRLAKVFMPPTQRREIWNDLIHALRAQGRHLEADAMEQRRDEDLASSSA
jgi:tetratricopeptide (TPR) repeat protein